jgi:hypothetical protein
MPPEIHVPYLLAETVLNKCGFVKIDVPLTSAPEMTWYVKGPFAVGIKKIFGYDAQLRMRVVEYCFFEFLYGKLLYGNNSILGMEIIKKISTTESLGTELVTNYFDTGATSTTKTDGLTAVLSFIEKIPDDLVLCFGIKWAMPLIEAYFKTNNSF